MILVWTGDKILRGPTREWRTHIHTHTDLIDADNGNKNISIATFNKKMHYYHRNKLTRIKAWSHLELYQYCFKRVSMKKHWIIRYIIKLLIIVLIWKNVRKVYRQLNTRNNMNIRTYNYMLPSCIREKEWYLISSLQVSYYLIMTNTISGHEMCRGLFAKRSEADNRTWNSSWINRDRQYNWYQVLFHDRSTVHFTFVTTNMKDQGVP